MDSEKSSFTSSFVDVTKEPEYIKLMDENLLLKPENDFLKKNFEKYLEYFNNCASQNERVTGMQAEQIKKLENDINDKTNVLEDKMNKLKICEENLNNFNMHKYVAESELLIEQLTKEKSDLLEKFETVSTNSENQNRLINYYQERLTNKVQESSILNIKMAEIKNTILENKYH